MLTEKT